MAVPPNISSRINKRAWRLVEAFHRLPPRRRLVIKTFIVVFATAAAYLWMSALDCPFC